MKKCHKTKQQFGTVLSFKKPAIYGTVDAPETGNFTIDLNDAQLCEVVQCLHNSPIAPTFPASFELRGGGSYVTGSLNLLSFEYINPTKVFYTIV